MLKKLKRNAKRGDYLHLYSNKTYMMLSQPSYFKERYTGDSITIQIQ